MNYKNFLDYYLDHEQIALSDSQLRSIVNDDSQRVIAYHELAQMNTVTDLFGKKDAIVLLHENSHNAGHYCSLLLKKDKNGLNYVEYFDSFGDALETSIKKFKYEKINYLRNILEQSKKLNIIRYYTQNKRIYQKDRIATQTCGRWACFRIIHKNLNLEEFNAFLTPINKSMRYDVFITLLTDLNIRYN